MFLSFQGDRARIRGLTPQAIGAEVAGTAVKTTNEAINKLNPLFLERSVVVFRTTTPSSHTGSTTERTIYTATIPASLIGDNSIFEIFSLFSMSSSSGGKSFRFKMNGVLIADVNPTPARPSFQMQRFIVNRNSRKIQISSPAINAEAVGTVINPNSNYTIDMTNGLTFEVAVQTAVASDFIRLEHCFCRLTT